MVSLSTVIYILPSFVASKYDVSITLLTVFPLSNEKYPVSAVSIKLVSGILYIFPLAPISLPITWMFSLITGGFSTVSNVSIILLSTLYGAVFCPHQLLFILLTGPYIEQ